MAYSTSADLQQAFGGAERLKQATDWNHDDVADVDVIAWAIAKADGVIDSFVNKQYLVPLSVPIPRPIVDASADLARYFIRTSPGMADDFDVKTFERVESWLKGVADGSITIGCDPVPTKAGARIDGVSERSTLKDYSRAKLRGFS